jgi:hypothetical protein
MAREGRSWHSGWYVLAGTENTSSGSSASTGRAGLGDPGKLVCWLKEENAMRAKGFRTATLLLMIACGSLVFQSCPLTGLLDECFAENTISESEYEDLNAAQQLLYEENSCGRYEPRSSFLADLFD